MKKEKHEEISNEVLDEINSALNDKRGLLVHQRRLAFALSLGAENILALYFHRLDIIKEGSKIDHRWFKRKKEKVFEQLQKQTTSPINSVENIGDIIKLISKIEEKRDQLAYGAPATEGILQEKINLFFELKRITKC